MLCDPYLTEPKAMVPGQVFFGCHFELDGCMPAEVGVGV